MADGAGSRGGSGGGGSAAGGGGSAAGHAERSGCCRGCGCGCEGGPPVVDYGALLQLFRCPVCADYLRPPIPQCKKGHVLCEQCRPRVKGVCPECRQAVGNQTNLMMERMAALIRFPCTHASKGCAALVQHREKVHHEAVCHFRPVHCQYAQSGCPTVLSLHQMAAHVRQCNFRPAWSSINRQLSAP